MTSNASVVVVRYRTTVDRYGDTAPSPVLPARFAVPGCVVSPRVSNELFGPGRDGAVTGITIHAPASADIRATDQLEVDGDLFIIDGSVSRWSSPFSKLAGIEVAAKRAVG